MENSDRNSTNMTPQGVTNITLSMEQFNLLLAQREGPTLTSAVPSAVLQSDSQTTTHRTDLSTLRYTPRVRWVDMPTLELGVSVILDEWFVAFETKMKAAQVPKEHWNQLFEQCPTVSREAKESFADVLEQGDYELLRKSILEEHTPKDSLNIIRMKMCVLKGECREEVRAELTRLRDLYNRAARGCNRETITMYDAIRPFIAAFPKDVGAELEKHVEDALRSENPFSAIYSKAPSTRQQKGHNKEPLCQLSALASTKPGTDVWEDEEESGNHTRLSSSTTGSSKRQDALELLLAMQNLATGNVQPKLRSCQACGGACTSRASCPAINQYCFLCAKQGHYATMCRTMRAGRSEPYRTDAHPNYRSMRSRPPTRGFRPSPRGNNPSYGRQFSTGQDSFAQNANLCPIGVTCAQPTAEIPICVDNLWFPALVDTGASASFISTATFEQLRSQFKTRNRQLNIRTGLGHKETLRRQVSLPFSVGDFSGAGWFYIADALSHSVIIGYNMQRRYNITAIPAEGHVRLPSGKAVPFLPQAAFRHPPLMATTIVDSSQWSSKLVIGTAPSDSALADLQRVLDKVAFASDAQPYGRATGTTHRILLTDQRPIRQSLRPTSPLERQIIRKEVSRLLQLGAIRPSRSPWASPIVLVKKKDNSTRFCVDYRKLNDNTVKDSHPLPRIEDLLESLQGCQYFTSLDAASGYWQIAMDAESVSKTAFLCTEGLFEWQVMPFGLCNAPATYQRAMNELLSDLIGICCLVYIDDVLIYGSTWEEHLRAVTLVTDRLREAGFLLQAKKCRVAVKEVEFLGHIVSRDGIHPDPAKIAKLKDFPVPRDVKSLRAFLGLAGYYRRFIKDFATTSSPLTELLKLDHPWKWGIDESRSFAKLQKSLWSEVTCAHPDFSLPFIVDCDASETGMGAVLAQKYPEGERPLAFISRKFTSAEQKWHIREKEALSIVYALEKFRRFLLGTNFLVRTDHESLTWFMEAKSGRLSRWAITLAEFQPFRIYHRKGKTHSNVDAFTRIFAESECVPDKATLGSLSTAFPPLYSIDNATLRHSQSSIQLEALLRSNVDVELHDEIVGIRTSKGWRPLLPKELAMDVARRWHAHPLGGHLGVSRVFYAMSKQFIVLGGRHTVRQALHGCQECMLRKRPLTNFGLLQSKPPSEPWATVAMDFCGPYTPSDNGYRYVLVFVDNFTKWVELVPTKDQTAITVVNAFYQHIICRHGCPQNLLSDNGPQFMSTLTMSLCSYFGINKVFSTTYYPQGNGYAERMMRTLNNSLSSLSAHSGQEWDIFLPGLAFAYNSTIHAATGISPFELVSGRYPQLPGSAPMPAEIKEHSSEWSYLRKLRNIISASVERARQSVYQYWEKMKSRYDESRKDILLGPGAQVLVRLSEYERNQFPCKKLAPRWSSPAKVLKQLPDGASYQILLGNKQIQTVNIARLLPLSDPLWSEPTATPLPTYLSAPPTRPTCLPSSNDDMDDELSTDGEVEVVSEFWPAKRPHTSPMVASVLSPVRAPRERPEVNAQGRSSVVNTTHSAMPQRPVQQEVCHLEQVSTQVCHLEQVPTSTPDTSFLRRPKRISDVIYPVREVVGYDKNGDGEDIFLVRWKGLPYSAASWEREASIPNVHRHLEKFKSTWNRMHPGNLFTVPEVTGTATFEEGEVLDPPAALSTGGLDKT